MIEAQIQARTKQIRRQGSVRADPVHVAVAIVAAHFSRQPQSAVCVVGEAARPAMIVEVAEGIAWIKIDVAISAVNFEARHQLSRWTRILVGTGRRLWSRKRGRPR